MAVVPTTPEDVARLAALARIDIPEADRARFAAEFESVLSYVSRLNELTLQGAARTLPAVRNVLREDGEPNVPGTYTEVLARAFPERDGDYLSVKQIISHD